MRWKPSRKGRLAPGNFSTQPYGENPDDYVRLMYVAATRARQKLHISSFSNDELGNQLLSTPLLGNMAHENIDSPSVSDTEVLEAKLRWPLVSTKDERQLLASRIEDFVLSPSALLDFLDITEAGPEAFKERWLLKLPREQSAAGGYGSAVHGAMQTAQRLVNTGKFSIDTVLDRFDSDIEKQFLAPHDLKRLKQKGEELLRTVLKRRSTILPQGAESELSLKVTLPGGELVKGNLDQLVADETSVLISDYKTGKPLSSLDTKNKQLLRKAWKHKNQLAFYALLAQNTRRFKTKTISTQVLYLEDESGVPKALRYTPSLEDIVRLEKLLVAVWHKIQKLDLPDTSAYPETHEGVLLFEQDLIDGKV